MIIVISAIVAFATLIVMFHLAGNPIGGTHHQHIHLTDLTPTKTPMAEGSAAAQWACAAATSG